ncbi:TetR/AcrR family transcriptional regulator [Evansella tamaricis]|uniref:TetR/AcrR family transcriptional regulator C-terminal domain-containing protein n=1 Tax=Evansella tamaricis TaxID=2069301 RepID=A0ABS6JF95_9BACI|nr:TetR-like C-terminal domain-containing protein [Evansella tamaricis]MBU9712311.1 TetR/AcrR family transcriptional regulator C-terminal domain-containing protein [Evansella tamaricis]
MSAKLDRRKKYTRQVLKESFIKKLKEKPFSSITIKEICDYADINRSTFYSHYSDLKNLLNQIEDNIISDLNKTLSDYNHTKNEEAIQMIEKLLEYLAENRESSQTLFSEHGDPTFQKRVMQLAQNHMLKSLEGEGSNQTTFNSEYLSIYIVNGSIHVVQHWLKNGLKESPKDIAEMIANISFKGFSAYK